MWKKRLKTAFSLVISLWALATVVVFFINSFIFNLPLCTSDTIVKYDLIKAINDTPLLKANQIEALYVSNVSEAFYDERQKLRQCTADAKFSNSTVYPITYNISEHDGEYYVEVEITGLVNEMEKFFEELEQEMDKSIKKFEQEMDQSLLETEQELDRMTQELEQDLSDVEW